MTQGQSISQKHLWLPAKITAQA